MKLSDIKGERTLEVIAEIIDPIANIGEDKEAAELFVKKRVPKGMSAKQFLVQRVRKSVPVLLKTHKADVLKILATIEGRSVENYTKDLTLLSLINDCVELFTDDVFTTLFISAQTEERSGSARENTED